MTQNPIYRAVRRHIAGFLYVSHRLFSAALHTSFTVIIITSAQLSGSKRTASGLKALRLLTWAVTVYPIGWVMARAPPQTAAQARCDLRVTD